jgi:hypothetical protein
VATTVSRPIRPASTSNANSRSEKPPPLAHPGTLAVDGHAAADHQVHGVQLGHADPPTGPRRAGDGGGPAGRDLQPCRVEQDERTLVGQAGHGHVQELAVGQGSCPDRELGASGLALTTPAACHAANEASRAAAAGAPAKLGIRPVGAGETGHPLALQEGPDTLADRLLGPGRRLQARSGRSAHCCSPRGVPTKR